MEKDRTGRNLWQRIFLTMAVVCGILLLGELICLGLVWYLTGCEAASIGVIGGADGPTAIFVTTSVPVISRKVKIALCIAGLGAGVFGYRKMKAGK